MVKADERLAHGRTVNILASEKKISPATIHLADGKSIACNSTWAATDWLKANGFYADGAQSYYVS